MPITCPQCSQVNPDGSAYCVKCGMQMPQTNQFSPTVISTSMPTEVQQKGGGGRPGPMSPAANFAPPSGPSNWPPPGEPPTGQGYTPPTGQGYRSPAGTPYTPQGSASTSAPGSSPTGINAGPSASFPVYDTYQPAGGTQWAPQVQPPPPPGSAIGGVQGLGSLRRAFAGHGSLVAHHSWLLPGDFAQAGALHALVGERMRERTIGQLEAHSTKLIERGIATEEREYLVVHRGVCTEFIYTAPAGQDLYISRATTALPAISMVRVIIYSLLALLMIFGFVWHPSITTATAQIDYGAIVASFFFTLLSYVMLFFFVIVLMRSIINWLVENDFWEFLRPSLLNDFQLDDVALLEHEADDVIRQSVGQLGLEASKITPPPLGYQPKRKIRGAEFIFF